MDPHMQAYAYPNGYCFLSTGILNRTENEDQLAMILAHEMVHYVRQHTVELYNHIQKPVIGSGLPGTNPDRAACGEATQRKIDAAEYQADKEGLAILKGAGYCQAEILSLLSNLINSLQDQERHKRRLYCQQCPR